MLTTFRTAAAPPRERLDYWQETVSRTLVGVDCRLGTGQFDGRVSILEACGFTVSTLGAVGHSAERDRARVAHDDDFDMLFLQLRGDMQVEVGGERLAIRPGDFYYYRGAMPHMLSFPDRFEHVTIRLPRRHAIDRLRALNQLGSFRLPGDGPLGRVAAATLRGLVDVADGLEERAAGAAARAAADLFFAAVEQDAGLSAAGPLRTGHRALILRARAAAEARHADPDLRPADVAAVVGVTERHLNRVLAAAGTTLGGLIRGVRLAAADRALADPLQVRRTVTEIAFACGFTDSSAFSRAYRAAYGRTPRDRRPVSVL